MSSDDADDADLSAPSSSQSTRSTQSARLEAAEAELQGLYAAELVPAAFERRDPIPDGYPASDEEDFRYLAEQGDWRTLGMSVRGLSHQHHGVYREDAMDACFVDPWIVAAVCDGAGSSSLARLGAQVASSAAVQAMRDRIQSRPEVFTTGFAPSEARLSMLMHVGVAAAHQAVARRAEEEGRRVGDFFTTLLLVAHGHFASGQVAATAQIGDGAICAFIDTGEEQLRAALLATPEMANFAGGTRFLNQVPQEEWQDHIWVRHLPPETRAIMLMSDGVADDFKPLEQRAWKLMRAFTHDVFLADDVSTMREQFRKLITFERKGSFDDRTILVIYH